MEEVHRSPRVDGEQAREDDGDSPTRLVVHFREAVVDPICDWDTGDEQDGTERVGWAPVAGLYPCF